MPWWFWLSLGFGVGSLYGTFMTAWYARRRHKGGAA